MSETVVKTSYLTQEAFDRLKAELAELSGPGRADIVAKIEAAREEGDLKENGGYHAAREEQGKMEARIRQLTQLLENAVIGETPADDGIVEPGMVVTVEMFGEEVTFLLGSREIADPEVQAALQASKVDELSTPTLNPGESYDDVLADRSAYEDFDANSYFGGKGFGFVRLQQLATEHLLGAR